jgi:hypothetical protein
VPLHLGEHLIVIQRAAHGLEFPYSRHTIFLVAVLSSNEEGSTSDELVVALVDDTTGAVAIEKVDGKEQSLGEELKCSVSFYQEIKEIWAHKPLDLSLNVDRVDIGEGL